MATTSPDNIYSPDGSSQFSLVSDLATMSQSVQTALNRKGGTQLGTKAERLALPSPRNGTMWVDTDNAMTYQYRSGKWYPEIEVVPLVNSAMRWVDAFQKVRNGGFVVTNFGRTVQMAVRLQQVHKFSWASGSFRNNVNGALVIPEHLRPEYPISFEVNTWSEQAGSGMMGIGLFPSGFMRFRPHYFFRNMKDDNSVYVELHSPMWLVRNVVGGIKG